MTEAETPEAIPADLQGEFERDVTAEDNEAAGAVFGMPPGEIPLGGAMLVVEADGVVFVTHADGGHEDLIFEVAGDRVTVTGGSYCPDPASTATYRWARSEESLVLTPIDNDCIDRRAVLAGTWTAK